MLFNPSSTSVNVFVVVKRNDLFCHLSEEYRFTVKWAQFVPILLK